MPFITSLTGSAAGGQGAGGSGSGSGSGSTPGSVNIKNVKITCLWENASPSSNFGSSEQTTVTVPIDLSPYQMVYIEYLTANTNVNNRQSVWCLKDRYCMMDFMHGAQQLYGARRCNVTSAGVTFEPAYNHSTTPEYKYAIPVAIYGAFQMTYDQFATFQTRVITLPAASWTSSNTVFTQTVAVNGLPSNAIAIISPSQDSHTEYMRSGVYASEQQTNSLVFTATVQPSSDLTVQVIWPYGGRT